MKSRSERRRIIKSTGGQNKKKQKKDLIESMINLKGGKMEKNGGGQIREGRKAEERKHRR